MGLIFFKLYFKKAKRVLMCFREFVIISQARWDRELIFADIGSPYKCYKSKLVALSKAFPYAAHGGLRITYVLLFL